MQVSGKIDSPCCSNWALAEGFNRDFRMDNLYSKENLKAYVSSLILLSGITPLNLKNTSLILVVYQILLCCDQEYILFIYYILYYLLLYIVYHLLYIIY